MVNLQADFYERKFTETHPWRWYYSLFLPIHLGMYKTYWIQKRMKKGSKVLDLGCGGGREYLAKKFEMFGIDISRTAVENAKRIYSDAKLGDVRSIPYPDSVFDYVISMDLLGHIPIAEKDRVIAEIHRVLKFGGVTLHYIETERRANKLKEKYPELYKKYFVMQDGHIGLESPSRTLARFERFKILGYAGHAAVLSPIEDYAKRFDNEMRNINVWIKFMTGLSKLVDGHTYLRFLVNCLLGFPARFANRLASLDHSSGIFVAAQKH